MKRKDDRRIYGGFWSLWRFMLRSLLFRSCVMSSGKPVRTAYCLSCSWPKGEPIYVKIPSRSTVVQISNNACIVVWTVQIILNETPPYCRIAVMVRGRTDVVSILTKILPITLNGTVRWGLRMCLTVVFIVAWIPQIMKDGIARRRHPVIKLRCCQIGVLLATCIFLIRLTESVRW